MSGPNNFERPGVARRIRAAISSALGRGGSNGYFERPSGTERARLLCNNLNAQARRHLLVSVGNVFCAVLCAVHRFGSLGVACAYACVSEIYIFVVSQGFLHPSVGNRCFAKIVTPKRVKPLCL